MTASAATTGPIPGIGIFRNGTSYSTGTGYDRYSMITVGVSNASAAGALPGRSLVYMSGTSVQTAWSTGVPYDQALANGWLLKDSSGNYLRTPYSAYVGDVGSSAYQQAFISNVSSFLWANGDDGVFIDDMYMTLEGFTAQPAKYPTQQSWEDATASFAAAVGSALKAKGFYVMFNSEGYIPGNSASDTGALTVTWWQRLAPYANGLLVEDWLQNPGNLSQLRSDGAAWYQNWTGWQSLVATAQNMGVDFFPSVSGTTTSIATMRYGKASFLLDWNGGGSAMVYSVSSGDPWNLEWTMDIGLPAAAKYQVGVGWRREYTGGTALVNPSATASQTFSLGGTYYQADGTAVTSVTLAPTSGIVLRKDTQLASASITTAPTESSAPAVSGTAQAGNTLTASTGSWSGSPTSYAYQWQRCSSTGGSCASVSGATSSSYSLTTNDVGATVRAVVTATNSSGSASAASSVTAVVATTSTTSTTTTAPVNSSAPAVSGTAQAGNTLTASTGSWSGSPTSYAYQWQRCSSTGGSCGAISGATGSSYLLQSADVGFTARVTVRASNAAGSGSATSVATAIVAAASGTAPVNVALPVITVLSGTKSTLTVSTGTWSGSPTTYVYKWERCPDATTPCVVITGQTASTYALTRVDVGSYIKAEIQASNSFGAAVVSSARVGPVRPGQHL